MQAGVKAEDSIFFGLLYLTELSLKDNKLKHLIALQGIVASANFIPESEQMGHDLGREYEQKAKPRNGYTLKKIWIDDNPILRDIALWYLSFMYVIVSESHHAIPAPQSRISRVFREQCSAQTCL